MPIEVKGIEEIKAKLDRLSNEKTKLAIQRAGIRRAAKVLIEAMKQRVPFDTGKLEGSIGMQVKKNSGRLAALIGPDKKFNFIGRFHEFGTKYMVGEHWMQKSFDESANQALDAYVAEALRLFEKHEYDDLMAAIEASLQPLPGEE
jgi:HK97 gp10 family phage protein